MFELANVPTILGLAASEWEALSLGMDGALDEDTDWQTSIAKMKGGNQDASYQTCCTKVHYFRAGFSFVRFLQNHWTAIIAVSGSAVAGLVYLKTNIFNGG